MSGPSPPPPSAPWRFCCFSFKVAAIAELARSGSKPAAALAPSFPDEDDAAAAADDDRGDGDGDGDEEVAGE
jgi:hypothetical protein